MKRVEAEAKLRQLQSAGPARARMLADDLLAAAPGFDAPLRHTIRHALLGVGLDAPEIPARALSPGETWLLLYEPPREGWAIRLRVSHEATTDERVAREVRRAHRGLVHAAACACRQLGRPEPPSLEFDVPFGNFEIEGSSLGLSVAIASLSRTLGRAPSSTVAGSAQVDEEGRLQPVEHMAEKLAALRRGWPEVTRVVVAARQTLPDASPFAPVRCETFADAVIAFGLSFEDLPPANLSAFVDRVARFGTDNGLPHDGQEWARLSTVAWEASAALASDEPLKSVEAVLWAARFAIHSGDPNAGTRLLRGLALDASEPYPELQVCRLFTDANSAMDEERNDDAIALASHAVTLCDALTASDRRELLGQALGTHGRALMHAGRLDAAENALRKALAHHQAVLPKEAPRSACYLATCLRLAGRPRDAAAVTDDALAKAEKLTRRWNDAVTTQLYLHLERGRVRAALGMWAEAADDFARVCDGQLGDSSYPRLGALRGLASALRVLGRTEEADDSLRACLAVARTASMPILRKVAAIAAGEALLADAGPVAVSRSELEDAWTAVFGPGTDPDHVAAVVRAWVY